MILSQRYVVNARMFVEVGLGLKVGSVPIARTASLYEISGTNWLGIGDEGADGDTTPAIGTSLLSSEDAILLVALLSTNRLATYFGVLHYIARKSMHRRFEAKKLIDSLGD